MMTMKKVKNGLLVYSLVALLSFSVIGAQELSSKECENLGFTGLALCSDCNSFADFVKDQGPQLLLFLYLAYTSRLTLLLCDLYDFDLGESISICLYGSSII